MDTQHSIRILTLGLLLSSGCSTASSPVEVHNRALLDRSVVADKFGDNNDTTTTEELQALAGYFSSNQGAWCLQACPLDDHESLTISAQQVRLSFVLATHPYPSEESLRAAYSGIAIKTPTVSVIVLQQLDGQIYAVTYYRSPGATFSNAVWTQLQITPSLILGASQSVPDRVFSYGVAAGQSRGCGP